jgi:dTDP-4-dehydrorhamnose reductase
MDLMINNKGEEYKINKILVFGSTGMLGRYISTFFKQKKELIVINVCCRITKETIGNVEECLLENKIDEKTCIINCIGQIPQRKTEDLDNKTYFLVNSIFPHVLWDVCKKYGAKMIQPTTDCVFSGRRNEGNYVETDEHDETSLYGMSKSLGEPLGCTVIRTSIIGRELENKKSFMEWVIESAENKTEINGWTNHYWNGITCLEYCHVVEKIIQDDIFWSGVRHIFSPNIVSKYEMVGYIKEVYNLDVKINSMEYQEVINKSLGSNYKNIFEIKNLKEQIEYLEKYDLNIYKWKH